MYVRRNRKRRVDGTERIELMLAHNIRVEDADGDAVTKPIVMARLGNERDVDVDMVDSMIAALERYKAKRRAELEANGKHETPAEEAVAVQRVMRPLAPMLRIMASKQLGVRLVVERVWKQLELDLVFTALQAEYCRTLPLERLVFAMVLNRLVDPMAKLACNDWIADQAHFPEADEWTVDHFYQALDKIEANADVITDHVARALLQSVPEEERRRLLIDSTALFTEAAMDDEQRAEIEAWWKDFEAGKGLKPIDPRPQVVNEPPLRMRGKSKDHRPEAPQVVVGLVTTMSGLPVSHSVHPGNTSDKAVTRHLVQDALGRHPEQAVTWVMDSGMAGMPNLRWIAEQQANAGWLCTVKLRESAMVEALLKLPGRWKQLARKAPEGPWTYRCMEVPVEQRVDPKRPERLIAVNSPSRARRDTRKLEDEIRQVKRLIAKDPSPPARGEKARKLSTPARSRLTRWRNGKLELDEDAIKRERRLAGVKVLRTPDMSLPVEKLLDGYDDLLKLEGDFRTFKSPLRVRPMYHRSAHRIRAHVMVCFLALVCRSVIERRSGRTWEQLKKGLSQIHAVKMGHGSDTWWQTSELTGAAWEALEACGVASVEQRWVLSSTPTVRWSK